MTGFSPSMVPLTWPDFIIVLVLVGFGGFGFAMGLIQVVGGLVGIGLGAFAASWWHASLGQWLASVAPVSERVGSWLAYAGILVVAQRICGLAFYWLNRALGLLNFLPLFKSLNRVAGGLFGLLEGALLMGFILQFVQSSRVPGMEAWLQASQFGAWLVSLAELMQQFLPLLTPPAAGVTPPYDSPAVV